jgi:prepilin-type N-terminal cleavage/methylation domain-containing protein
MKTPIYTAARLSQSSPQPSSGGYSLVELLFVLAVLGICISLGAVSLVHGMRTQEARGAAQCWQAAAGWAQIEAIWQGGSVRVNYAPGSLTLSGASAGSGGDLAGSIPLAPVTTNLARWRDASGATVEFGGALAAPNGGGSLFFGAESGSYRVIVRPESGLTIRTRMEMGQ